MAEAAGERAADLRGDAERAAVFLGNMNGLGFLAIGKAQQPFARAVDGLLVDDHSGAFDHVMLGELGAEILRQRGHRREIGRPAKIDPVPELARAKGGLADGFQLRGQLGPVEADQVLA